MAFHQILTKLLSNTSGGQNNCCRRTWTNNLSGSIKDTCKALFGDYKNGNVRIISGILYQEITDSRKKTCPDEPQYDPMIG